MPLHLLLLLLLVLSAFTAPGQQLHANDNQSVCGKPPCVFVHVDAVSYYDSPDSRIQKSRVSKLPNIFWSPAAKAPTS